MTKREVFKFILYVAGDAQNSVEAIANLTALCRLHLPGQHDIDIVDVFQQPERALKDGIFLTPTLVKIAPQPARQIIGTLGRTETVLQALGLTVELA